MVPEVSKYAIRNGRVVAACVSFATAIASIKTKSIDTKRHKGASIGAAAKLHGESILLFIAETSWI
jgi:hypothetical protein